MPAEGESWDQRYRRDGYWAGTEPAAFLREVLPLLPRGRGVDVAMGEGRNAVFLALSGWSVTGLERSAAGLEKAEALGRAQGIAVVRAKPPEPKLWLSAPGMVLFETDLERFPWPAAQWDLMVCFNFLLRPALPRMAQALRPGGMLVYETYTLEQLDFPAGPRNPEYLLRPGELRESFASLQLVFYRELKAGRGIASLLARKR